ncbi:DUF3300 domain-containing protein [Tropicimonas sp. S265A]|uniref:DUF3300 domain-containing protein n=1 Tax=Tropicimonas sp. S265A TaxID=3415134 RepID=UPI003C7DF36C
MRTCFSAVLATILAVGLSSVHAQEAAAPVDAPAPEAAAEDAALLTQAELETLMAPVALYPDTLLIQILVAATYPLDIVKADRFVTANAESDPDTLQTSLEAEGWDPSVTVLATAFPDVLADMAVHVEWTDAVGTAMLAQSEDVLNAVQVLRNQAIETGALISGEAQTVETDAEDNVVITPADPEVVYVPQYDPAVVYDNSLSDALVTSALVFTSFVVIDAIFDDDDDWNNYWGCRNCGGWGGGPIYRNPDIDIDVDGNVNIGNRVDLGDRTSVGDIGWKPDPSREKDARDKIAARRGDTGATQLPIDKPSSRPAASRGDALRNDLAARSGAADISRPTNRASLPQIDRPSGGSAGRLPQVERPSTRPSADKAAAIKKTANRPAAAEKPAVKKPATKKVAAKKKVAPQKSAIKQRGGSNKARAAANRGKAGKLKARR